MQRERRAYVLCGGISTSQLAISAWSHAAHAMQVVYSAAEAPVQAAPPVAFHADGATALCAASKARTTAEDRLDATVRRSGTMARAHAYGCGNRELSSRALKGL